MAKEKHEISPYCEATSHHTISSGHGKRDRKKCTCPYTVKLVKEYNKIRNARRRILPNNAHLASSRAKPKPIASGYYPDFTGGVCTTERGVETAQRGLNDQSTNKGIRERERAKALCNTGPCPIRDSICRPWVISQESPRGSWGGVWGGMDPWNRQGLELVIRDGRAEVIPWQEPNSIDSHGSTPERSDEE